MSRTASSLAGGFVLAGLLLLPGVVQAQSVIAGTVKDASGGVLPGVTVEASSEALIEKVRVVQTDGNGQFRIVDLRPGAYVVTFTLTGFQTLRRDGIELATDFTATLNIDMRVGALEETITVSGAAPIVDVQSAAAVTVLDKDAIDNIPSGRTIQGLGQLIPGVNLSLPDVGGSRAAHADLHVGARPERGPEHHHGRRPHGERPRGERRGAELLQRCGQPGNELPDGRRRRGSFRRRRQPEHGARARAATGSAAIRRWPSGPASGRATT